MALYMVSGGVSAQDIRSGNREIAAPESVMDLLSGAMGQPPGGFPKDVQKLILRGRPIVDGRPGATLPPADIEATRVKVTGILGREATDRECVTHLLYPKVYEEFVEHLKSYGDVSFLPTPNFFYGPDTTEEISVDIETGKRLIIRFLAVGQPKPNGTRTVFFELNGQPREVEVVDSTLETTITHAVKADPADPTQVAASMPGMVIGVAVKVGDSITKGQKLLALEAMKMETIISADRDGTIEQLLVKSGSQVSAGDLLLVVK